MVFSDEYDRALWLVLVGDKSNREEIANLVTSIPDEIYQQIYTQLGDYFKILETEIDGSLNFKKMISPSDEINYFFNIDMGVEELNIKLCKWDSSSERVEENYELTLVPIARTDLSEISFSKPKYIGSYSYENSRLKVFNKRRLEVVFGCDREYQMRRTPLGVIINRLNGSFLFKRVDLSKMPYDITLNDLNNKACRNRLIRGRKRY